MDRMSMEMTRIRQQEIERETRHRIYAINLRGSRRRDGALRFIRLDRS